jgi:hypothetical protein
MQKQKPNSLPATTIRLALGVGGILILLALLIAIPPSKNATANSNDKSQAISKYPFISGTRLDSCSLCHTTSIPSLNGYGSAYLNNGRNLNAFGLIENQDSDGDGFTNIQEINALFFPGDPNDHPPSVTATATRTSTAVPPTPTRTSTSVPPTPTRTNTSLPPTPTRTSTSLPATPTQTYTPVAPTATGTLIPPTPTGTSVLPSPTQTFVPPSATPTVTPMVTPTVTPTGTSILPTPTSTSLPPTAPPTSIVPSATPTVTPTVIPTGTSIPPTPTSSPLPPTATPTSIPPSATPTIQPPTPTEPAPTPVVAPGLNLEIRSINITERVRLGDDRPVIVSVQLRRLSQAGGEGIIRVTGTQNGERIYYGIRTVKIDKKGETAWFSLPSYLPKQKGTIHWKVEVIDDHPDGDIRAASTNVNSAKEDEHNNEGQDRDRH